MSGGIFIGMEQIDIIVVPVDAGTNDWTLVSDYPFAITHDGQSWTASEYGEAYKYRTTHFIAPIEAKVSIRVDGLLVEISRESRDEHL